MSAPAFLFDSEPRRTIELLRETGQITVVCLRGEFDVANVSSLRDQIDQALASGDDLIFDLSETTFIDSSVIHTLCQTARRVDGRAQAVVLQTGAAPTIERALKICGIERVVPLAYDRKQAVELVEQSSTTGSVRTPLFAQAGVGSDHAKLVRPGSGET